MSDGGRRRALLEVEVWKSSQKWSVPRSAVRSIAWLAGFGDNGRQHSSDDLLVRFTDGAHHRAVQNESLFLPHSQH